MIFGHHLVKLTNNHKVLTQHGWKKVKYLSKLDLISVLDKYNFIHFLRKGYHLNIFSFFTSRYTIHQCNQPTYVCNNERERTMFYDETIKYVKIC